jgi:hypothetical protein
VFHQFSVPHALIGGLAVGLHGHPRATVDIDLIVAAPALTVAPVLQVLAALGFRLDLPAVIREWNQHQMIAIWYGNVRVDWMKPVLPVFQHVVDRSESMNLLGAKINVASVEGLILCKLLADRSQDRADVEALIEANLDHIDVDLVEQEWQTVADTNDPRIVAFRAVLDASRRQRKSD